jgi:CheY-like chemotaxis protein
VKVVDGRIHALARAHNQITDDHWGPAPLQALIDAESAAFADRIDAIVADGPPTLLNPSAYSSMALVVHELVTNSTKYGGLSTTDGRVNIDWHRESNRDLVLTWQESGGPAVKPPTRKGFGTTIIERSVPYDLGGTAEAHYDEDGFRARFTIPARHVSEPKNHAGPAIRLMRPTHSHAPKPPPSLLVGKTAMLVEDSLIIALDAEDIIGRLGAAHVATSSTVEAALDSLMQLTPAIAILDINLGDQNSFGIADRLLEMNVPFLFASGYGEQAKLPLDHRSRIVVQKPYTIENLARGIAELLGIDSQM